MICAPNKPHGWAARASLKYAGAGEIVVQIETERHEARCSDIDQGPGDSAEHSPRLFDRYYRADASGASRLGLGLYISRMIGEPHGGRNWTASEPGRGAALTIVLPMD
jgi:signal transduction histidine kinase